jgi:hypothetical protein
MAPLEPGTTWLRLAWTDSGGRLALFAFLQAAPVPLTRRGQTFGRYLNCRVRPSCRDDDERLERGLVKRFAGVRDNGRDLWMGQQTTAPGSVEEHVRR